MLTNVKCRQWTHENLLLILQLFSKFENFCNKKTHGNLYSPFKWMAFFFLLIKSEWLNMPRGTLRFVHAVLTLQEEAKQHVTVNDFY